MSELLTAYASLRLQAVDACVIALAERFDRLREVAALDAATSWWWPHAICRKAGG